MSSGMRPPHLSHWLFQIPMRGNEYHRWMLAEIAQVQEFQIPMRGNEVCGFVGLTARERVSNPHEG